jgi:hypothetical protein
MTTKKSVPSANQDAPKGRPNWQIILIVMLIIVVGTALIYLGAIGLQWLMK